MCMSVCVRAPVCVSVGGWEAGKGGKSIRTPSLNTQTEPRTVANSHSSTNKRIKPRSLPCPFSKQLGEPAGRDRWVGERETGEGSVANFMRPPPARASVGRTSIYHSYTAYGSTHRLDARRELSIANFCTAAKNSAKRTSLASCSCQAAGCEILVETVR